MAVEDGTNNNPFGPQSEPQAPIPIVSPLAGLGTSPTRFNRRWIIGMGLVVSVLIAAISFVLLCSANVALPNDTLFLATATPRTANQLLTDEQRASLPDVWRQTLGTNSRWPVVFGVRGHSNTARAFVLGPRWGVPKNLEADETAYLVRSAGTSLREPSALSLNYRDSAFTFWFHRGMMQGWGDPEELFVSTTSATTTPIYFSIDHGTVILRNSRALQAASKNLDTKRTDSRRPMVADLSLNLAALSEHVNGAEVIGNLPIAALRTTLSSLSATPDIFEVQLNSSSTLSAVHLEFEEPLQAKEQRALLSTLEQTSEKHLLTLPDGTLADENRADPSLIPINSSSTDIIDVRSLDWKTSSTVSLVPANACGTGTWLARLSPSFLSRLEHIAPITTLWRPQTALQIWRNAKQEIIVCRES